MKGLVLIVLLLALIHSCRTCTEHQPYSCSEQKTVTEVTVGWCWKFWLLFRCKEEHETTKTLPSTCHRSVCCDGYSRENSSGKCKAVCFGSNTCPNGGSCVAPNQCVCPSGYVRPQCEDENECSDKNGGCTHICVNTKGSHHCSCPPGFILGSNQLTCKDVKECSVNNGGCAHTCVNTEGSHYCSCHPGFSLDSDQLTCRDHNECSVKNGGCSHTCNNTEGAHHCSCPPGFTLDSDQLTCKAEATTATTPQVTTPADCGNDNGGCSHFCIGMNETVQCTCPFLKKLADDNVTCIDVMGFYYGLCTLLAVCLVVTTFLLARKWCVRRCGGSRGNQRPTADEQKLFVVVTSSQEYGDEFKNNNLQKPPPYKETMDENDLHI